MRDARKQNAVTESFVPPHFFLLRVLLNEKTYFALKKCSFRKESEKTVRKILSLFITPCFKMKMGISFIQ